MSKTSGYIEGPSTRVFIEEPAPSFDSYQAALFSGMLGTITYINNLIL